MIGPSSRGGGSHFDQGAVAGPEQCLGMHFWMGSSKSKPTARPKPLPNLSGRWRLIQIWPTRTHRSALAKIFDGRAEETEASYQ